MQRAGAVPVIVRGAFLVPCMPCELFPQQTGMDAASIPHAPNSFLPTHASAPRLPTCMQGSAHCSQHPRYKTCACDHRMPARSLHVQNRCMQSVHARAKHAIIARTRARCMRARSLHVQPPHRADRHAAAAARPHHACRCIRTGAADARLEASTALRSEVSSCIV